MNTELDCGTALHYIHLVQRIMKGVVGIKWHSFIEWQWQNRSHSICHTFPMTTFHKHSPKINIMSSGQHLHEINSGFVAELRYWRIRDNVDYCDRTLLNEFRKNFLHRSSAGLTHVISIVAYLTEAKRIMLHPDVSGDKSNMLFEVKGSCVAERLERKVLAWKSRSSTSFFSNLFEIVFLRSIELDGHNTVLLLSSCLQRPKMFVNSVEMPFPCLNIESALSHSLFHQARPTSISLKNFFKISWMNTGSKSFS
jgi:hypothetical protein